MNPPEVVPNAGAMMAPAAADRYRTIDVARILGVSAARVRRMVRSGHCAPDRLGRAYRFAFQDLVLLRTAHGLMRSGIVSPKRVHRALRQLKSQLRGDRPLSGVRIYAAPGRIVVSDRDAFWAPESGQQMFHFAVDDLLVKSSAIASPSRLRRTETPGNRSAGDWYDYGVLIERDDPNGARQAYERALEIDPDWTDAYINLGRLVHEAGDPRGAAKFYGEALTRNPNDSVTHYNLAVAYEDLDRLVKARAHYDRALSHNPSFADAHFNLGRLLERMGERDAALKHLLAYRRLSDQI